MSWSRGLSVVSTPVVSRYVNHSSPVSQFRCRRFTHSHLPAGKPKSV